jgi:hypothetical protein
MCSGPRHGYLKELVLLYTSKKYTIEDGSNLRNARDPPCESFSLSIISSREVRYLLFFFKKSDVKVDVVFGWGEE